MRGLGINNTASLQSAEDPWKGYFNHGCHILWLCLFVFSTLVILDVFAPRTSNWTKLHTSLWITLSASISYLPFLKWFALKHQVLFLMAIDSQWFLMQMTSPHFLPSPELNLQQRQRARCFQKQFKHSSWELHSDLKPPAWCLGRLNESQKKMWCAEQGCFKGTYNIHLSCFEETSFHSGSFVFVCKD